MEFAFWDLYIIFFRFPKTKDLMKFISYVSNDVAWRILAQYRNRSSFDTYFQVIEKGKESILKYVIHKGSHLDGYIQSQKHIMMTLMFNLKFKLLWTYITNRSSKFSIIIYSKKIIKKRFGEWKCLALILSEEISDDMYSS